MLHALLEYADRVGISAEAGFKPKRIRWLLQFSPSGGYLGLVSQGDDRKGREFAKVPNLRFSGDTPMRQFLVDTAHYALLYGQDDPDDKLLTKHRYFLACLKDAAEVEPVLGRIAESLGDPDVRQKICADLDRQSPKAKATDNVSFVEMADAGPRIIVEQSTWHDWWQGYWPTLRKAKAGKIAMMRGLLSGELVKPAATHPKIKGLGNVGGNIETTLVGFNLRAFRSYGLEQSANAAISTELAEKYAAALNKLLADHSKRLAGAKVVYWYTHDVPPQDDPLDQLLGGESGFDNADLTDDGVVPPAVRDRAAAQATGRAGELLDAIRTGREPELRDCQYRALTLSGNAGRVVVRDWMEGPFENLAANVDKWFSDLAIVNRYGQGLAKPPKFLAVLGAMASSPFSRSGSNVYLLSPPKKPSSPYKCRPNTLRYSFFSPLFRALMRKFAFVRVEDEHVELLRPVVDAHRLALLVDGPFALERVAVADEEPNAVGPDVGEDLRVPAAFLLLEEVVKVFLHLRHQPRRVAEPH